MASHRKAAKPLSAQQRHENASRAAMAGVHQRGAATLGGNLRAGFAHKFEQEVDAADPTLHATDPLEYERRVAAALRDHMVALSRRSVASRAAKHSGK